MKRLILFGISALALMALTLTQVSQAQDPPGCKKHNRGLVKPNFVDEDGDGICDNKGTENCTGTGVCDGTGQGMGKGHGMGAGQGMGQGTHMRLRDGSCGQTPVTGAAATKSAAKGVKSRATAPAK